MNDGAKVARIEIVLMPCRALEAFRPSGSQSHHPHPGRRVLMPCRALEAFRPWGGIPGSGEVTSVLMPCRALEAFRHGVQGVGGRDSQGVLMPCRALEAFRQRWNRAERNSGTFGLNALSGIGGVQTQKNGARNGLASRTS